MCHIKAARVLSNAFFQIQTEKHQCQEPAWCSVGEQNDQTPPDHMMLESKRHDVALRHQSKGNAIIPAM